MVRIGINTFLWTTAWNDRTRRTLADVREMGFDAVQMPILSLDTFDAKDIRQATSELGLACYISAGLKDNTDVTSDDPETRGRAVAFLKQCLQIAATVGSPFLSGSFHSVFGKKSPGPVTAKHWEHSARALKQVAQEARRCGLPIVLEPINRYESFLVNTAAQAKKLMAMIDEPNVKTQFDTFHMGLEEDDFAAAITSVGDGLAHFHVAENHRGPFGQGMMPWDDVFKALCTIDYKGAIVIESFVPEVPEVATAACIWRKMVPSADALARELGPFGIRVNTICPDAVHEGSKLWEKGGHYSVGTAKRYGITEDDIPEYYRQRCALKVNIHPKDIAHAALFLAGDQSEKITGTILTVDGGVAYVR